MKKVKLKQIKEVVWATDLSKESKVCVPYIKFFNEKLKVNNHAIYILPKISEWVYERAFFSTDDFFAEIENSIELAKKNTEKYCDSLGLKFNVIQKD